MTSDPGGDRIGGSRDGSVNQYESPETQTANASERAGFGGLSLEMKKLLLKSKEKTEPFVPTESNLSQAFEDPQDSQDSESSDLDLDDDVDISDRITAEMLRSKYICQICTSGIGPKDPIWSCSQCYRCYDLDCISGWASRGLSGGKHEWKCPNCSGTYSKEIKQYRCWCGKVINPSFGGIIPHSCGQTCGAKLPGCVHKCSLPCHPGAHQQECTAIGPKMFCDCGKHARQWPCVITPYEGWKCREVCGERMPCGEHFCSRPCHNGLCGPCTHKVTDAQCYCGKNHTSDLICSEARLQVSELPDGKSWVGQYSCAEKCNITYDCGYHKCERDCHAIEASHSRCELAPVANEKCPCKQTFVVEILGRPRESCKEPIPTCEKQCKKLRSTCSHPCIAACHEGPCPPCLQIQKVSCRCQFSEFDVPCKFVADGNRAKCQSKCGTTMNCRRHKCQNVCCEDEPAARERERLRKKKIRSAGHFADDFPDVYETAHNCDKSCDRLLSCKQHYCKLPCHAGPCGPCMESSFEDWSCTCGKTVVLAPIRCGTQMPKCEYSCIHTHPECGHSSGHECHPESTPCPPCRRRVSKRCKCQKSEIKGALCHADASCGTECGKPLKCGHSCREICHSRPCSTDCQEPCSGLLPCGHEHVARCHPSEIPHLASDCKADVIRRCSCGRLATTVKCIDAPVEEGLAPDGRRKIVELKCDDECVAEARKRQLAEAFGIDLAPKWEYNSDLLDIYVSDRAFGDQVESKLISMVRNNSKVVRFPAMSKLKRHFVHLLAEEMLLESISKDSEPNRSVEVFLGSNGGRILPVSLSQSLPK